MKKKWSKSNAKHLLKVLGFLIAANVVGVLITFMSDLEFPKEYALYVNMANLFLVALKEYLNEKR